MTHLSVQTRTHTTTILSICLAMLLLAACTVVGPEADDTTSTVPAPAEESEMGEAEMEDSVETGEADAASSESRDVQQVLVENAIGLLVSERGLTESDISLASIEAVDWPDSSLGCPQDGMMYAQVITPGYRIMLEADGEMFEVHTGEQESSPVLLCAEE